ncbi:MAG: MFS transporter [Alphaproteobacteria bacterium]
MSQSTPLKAFAFIFVGLVILFTLGQFQRMGGGVIAAHLSQELALPAATLGGVMSAYFFASSLAQLPVGVLIDRYGPRAVLPAFGLLGAIGCAVFALAQDPIGLIVGRAALGGGFAAVMIGAFVVFARWVPQDRFSTISSIFGFISGLACLAATTPLAVALDRYGRENTFLVLTSITLFGAILAFAVIRDRPPGQAKPTGAPTTLLDSLRGVMAVLRHPATPSLSPMAFVTYIPLGSLGAMWLGPYLGSVHDLDATDRGNVIFIVLLAWNLGLGAYGPIDRWLGNRKRLILTTSAVAVTLFIGLATLPNPSLGVVVPWVVAIYLATPTYLIFMAHCRAIYPDHLTGRALTFFNLVAIMGVAIAQLGFGFIVGQFQDGHGHTDPDAYRFVFGTLGILIGIAAMVYVRAPDVTVTATKDAIP